MHKQAPGAFSGLRSRVVEQFRRPHGALGRVAGWVMAHRPSNIERNRWTVSLLDVRPSDSVLEIGCGPGLAIAMVLGRKPKAVVGIDHSVLMIETAAKRNAGALRAGVLQLEVGGLQELAKLERRFTKVFSVNVAQFFPDMPVAFRALSEVMEEDGVIATTHQPRNAHPTAADAHRMAEHISRALEDAGFSSPSIELLDLKPAPAVCVLARKRTAV